MNSFLAPRDAAGSVLVDAIVPLPKPPPRALPADRFVPVGVIRPDLRRDPVADCFVGSGIRLTGPHVRS